MNSIKSSEIKKPTSPKASGQSRAGCYSTEGAWVSVYEAALHGVALMAGPVTPRCECASKCRLYPWCCADWHLCGLLWTKLATHGTLVKRPQGLSKGVTRVFGVAPRQVADGGLSTLANKRDLRLAQPIGKKLGDE